MTKNIQHTYVVEGRGLFPLDMLRRDGAQFADRLEEVRSTNRSERRRVKLVTTYDRSTMWEPLDARWRSFRWRVVEHNGERFGDEPAGPSAPTQDSAEYTEAYGAMLEALKMARDAVLMLRGQVRSPVAGRNAQPAIDAIDAAIAKAEGRS